VSDRLARPSNPKLVTKDQILAAFPDVPDPEGWVGEVELARAKAKRNMLDKAASENWKPWSMSSTGKREVLRWWGGSVKYVEQIIRAHEEAAMKRHQHPALTERFICDQVEQLCLTTYVETLAPAFAVDDPAAIHAARTTKVSRPFQVPVIELRSSSGDRLILHGWQFFYLSHFVSYAKELLKQGRHMAQKRAWKAYDAWLEGGEPTWEPAPRSVASKAAVARVTEAISNLGISNPAFAKLAHVSPGTLRTFLKGQPVSFSSFESIAHAAGLTTEDLLAGH
jgi:hypothetical protein